MRNTTASTTTNSTPVDISEYPLIRIKTSTRGLRIVVQGWNTYDKNNYALVVYYIGILFIFLAYLHYVFDWVIKLVHPDRKKIIDKVDTTLNKRFKPIKEHDN